MSTEIFEQNNTKSKFTVEHNDSDFITVKKKLKNHEYTVEIMVFKKDDIDEFHRIQNELYSKSAEIQTLKEKVIRLLKKINR